jgi:hypothetical protein
MPGEPTKLKRVEKRIEKEVKEYAVVTAYFAFFLLSLTTYRKLILAEYNIPYYEYGWAFVQALVLAKVVLLGQAMSLGSRFEDRPIVLTTIWKSLIFAVLAAALVAGEHVAAALVHHRSVASEFQLSGGHGYEMIARFQLMLVAFVPFFALRELGRTIGMDSLSSILFRPRQGGSFTDRDSTQAKDD